MQGYRRSWPSARRDLDLALSAPTPGRLNALSPYSVAAAQADYGRLAIWWPEWGPGLCRLGALLPPSKQPFHARGRKEGKQGTPFQDNPPFSTWSPATVDLVPLTQTLSYFLLCLSYFLLCPKTASSLGPSECPRGPHPAQSPGGATLPPLPCQARYPHTSHCCCPLPPHGLLCQQIAGKGLKLWPYPRTSSLLQGT